MALAVHNLAVHKTVAAFAAACNAVRQRGKVLGLVPTMGALHEGHLRLIDEAHRHANEVAVTIFVNPTQFGPNEDFAAYPRTLERDVQLCMERGAALVFAPPASEMYPPGEQTRVTVGSLAQGLCGKSRPGHFSGVATVVTKLLSVAGPCVAVFGRKDYQQLKIIERLVKDLCLPVQVVGHPIVREADGLAMSSRNAYLSRQDRERALSLARGLTAASRAFLAGERAIAPLVQEVAAELASAQAVVDYIEIVDAEELMPLGETIAQPSALLAVAAFIGKTRLIDNCVLGVDPAPIAEGLGSGGAPRAP
ncbi:MAG TPA: pantoate--beta-alanine ligase [Polyangiaceae bacterium]|nr:pantoate--beta-alanine ligase [Polyangiaceae bacterium]